LASEESHPRRWFNDDRKRAFGGASERVIAFVCECSDPDCRESVILTEAEYDLLRPGLIVRDGHDAGLTP
jgi:hypothetical protein